MDHLVTVSAPFLADYGERETGQFTVGANDEVHARNLVWPWLEEEERISSVVASDTSNIPIGQVIPQKPIFPGIKKQTVGKAKLAYSGSQVCLLPVVGCGGVLNIEYPRLA